jgi:hypothetical protein
LIQALEFIEAEPTRKQELVQELAGMRLVGSVIKKVFAVNGHRDLITLIGSPNIENLGD